MNAMQAIRLRTFMEGQDDTSLRLIAALIPPVPPIPPARPRRRKAGRNGHVTVRYETSTEAPVPYYEVLKAAAENQRNWAWGKEVL